MKSDLRFEVLDNRRYTINGWGPWLINDRHCLEIIAVCRSRTTARRRAAQLNECARIADAHEQAQIAPRQEQAKCKP